MNYKERDLVGAIVRVCPLAQDVDIEALLPSKWGATLAKWFKQSEGDLDSTGLLMMAQAALQAGWPEVAYYCSGYGLQKGGPLQARFLFLRGRSLPYGEEARQQDCFTAALELARRVRDMDLVAEIADESRRTVGPFGGLGPFGPGMMDAGDLGMDDETLKKVMEFERRTKKYPKGRGLPFFGGSGFRPPYQRPAPRRAGGETRGRTPARNARRDPNERCLFDDVFGEEELDETPLPAGSEAELLDRSKDALARAAGVPSGAVELMAQIARLNGGRIPQSKKELDRLLDRYPELLRKIEKAMLESILEGGFDPYAEPEDEDEPLSSPFWPPIGRRGRKKKKRRR